MRHDVMPKVSKQKKDTNRVALALNVLVVMRHVCNTWKLSAKEAWGTGPALIEMINGVGQRFGNRILALLYGRTFPITGMGQVYEHVQSDPRLEDMLYATEQRFIDITPLGLQSPPMQKSAITPQHVRLAQVAQSTSDLLNVAAEHDPYIKDVLMCMALVHTYGFDYLQDYVAHSIGLQNDAQARMHRAQALWRSLNSATQ